LASPNSTIYTVNVATGALTARIQIPANQNGLAWTPGDILYSCGFTPGADNVITRIDLNANSVAPYITLPASFQGAELAWDQEDEFLYAEALNGELYKIDLGSSTASFVCTLPIQKVGIDIDHTGQMYGAEGNDGSNLFKFHLIDKTNCQMTFIQDFTSTNLGVFGIGVSPVSTFVPALSSWGLIAMGLLTVTAGTILVMRRRAATA